MRPGPTHAPHLAIFRPLRRLHLPLLLALGATAALRAANPYLPAWEYIPDGEPRLFGDRVDA